MFKIKQKPEDFIVKENMYFKPLKKGDYAYFLLTKRNWDTIKVMEKLSKVLNIPSKSISFSGLKDKGGMTTQYVAIYKVKSSDVTKLKLKDIKLRFIGYSDKPLKLGSHKSNSFSITIRNLSKSLEPKKFFCNYFDDQRFGGVRPVNHLIGKALLQGNFEKAMKIYLTRICSDETFEHKEFRMALYKNWNTFDVKIPGYLTNELKVVQHLRLSPRDFIGAFEKLPRRLITLFIQSFQDYLFNEVLSQSIKPDYKIKYALGELNCSNENLQFKIPLPGYDFKPETKIDKIIYSKLKNQKVKLEMFEDFKIKTSRRYASFGVSNLKISKLTKDDMNRGKFKQIVYFTLPKGSFATIVIKSLK